MSVLSEAELLTLEPHVPWCRPVLVRPWGAERLACRVCLRLDGFGRFRSAQFSSPAALAEHLIGEHPGAVALAVAKD